MQTCLLQKCLYLKRRATYIRPANPWNRVKINPQFVWMFQIAGANGMGVEFDTTEVDDPRQARRIIRPDGNDNVTVRNQGGRCSGARFW
jgi:hypothetical protein